MLTKKIKRILVLIVGLTMPYSFVNITGIFRTWAICTLSLFIYSAFIFVDFNKIICVLPSQYGKKVHLPFLFFCVLTLMNLLYVGDGPNVPIINLSIMSCLMFFYCILYHNLIDNKAVDICVLGFTIGVLVQPILFMMGIGVDFEDDFRMTIFNQNTNYIGIEVCIASSILLNEYIFKDKYNLKRKRFLLTIVLFPCLIFLLLAASRSAFLAFLAVIILSILFYPSRTSAKKIIGIICFLSLFVSTLDNFITKDMIIVERLIQTREEGDLSERDMLWASLYPCILEHPILGVGETGYFSVAAHTIGLKETSTGTLIPRSPHNVLIEIALYTGIFGLVTMFIFWISLLRNSLLLARIYKDSSALIFMIPFFVAILSQQILILCWPYLMYAFILVKSKKLRR